MILWQPSCIFITRSLKEKYCWTPTCLDITKPIRLGFVKAPRQQIHLLITIALVAIDFGLILTQLFNRIIPKNCHFVADCCWMFSIWLYCIESKWKSSEQKTFTSPRLPSLVLPTKSIKLNFIGCETSSWPPVLKHLIKDVIFYKMKDIYLFIS